MILHIRLLNAVRARTFRLLFARQFARYGKGSLIVAPIAIERPDRIAIGAGVYVAAHSCLAVRPESGGADGWLEIGDGTKIGRFNHIYATGSIRIGRKVLTANGVYISDNLHNYRDIDQAVLDQPLVQLGNVEIGEGSWLGQNACVVGAKIGRHCVVGANAVVTRDLPDYSVAVGAPAYVIRRYDTRTAAWRATDRSGQFIHD